jgi:hypothetical protein
MVQEGEDFTVFLDEDYVGFNKTEGERLFKEDGTDTEMLTNAVNFLGEFQQNVPGRAGSLSNSTSMTCCSRAIYACSVARPTVRIVARSTSTACLWSTRKSCAHWTKNHSRVCEGRRVRLDLRALAVALEYRPLGPPAGAARAG